MPPLRLVLVLSLGAFAIFLGAFAVGRAGRSPVADPGAAIETLPAARATAAIPGLGKVAGLPRLRVRHRAQKSDASATSTTSTTSGSTTSTATGSSPTASSSPKTTTTPPSATKKGTSKTTPSTADGDVSSGGNSLGG